MSLTPEELEIQPLSADDCERIAAQLKFEKHLRKQTANPDRPLLTIQHCERFLCTISTLREEVERLEKALDQAIDFAVIRLSDDPKPGTLETMRGLFWTHGGAASYSELAAHLRKRSEAKQAEQTATQPASTNQEKQI